VSNDIVARQDWVWSSFMNNDALLGYRLGVEAFIMKDDWMYIIMNNTKDFEPPSFALFASSKEKDSRGSNTSFSIRRDCKTVEEAKAIAIDHYVRETNKSLVVMK
jgi:hypothetical protein